MLVVDEKIVRNVGATRTEYDVDHLGKNLQQCSQKYVRFDLTFNGVNENNCTFLNNCRLKCTYVALAM